MRQTDMILLLSQAQMAVLVESCAAYRSYAWRTLPPTSERNQSLKAVQAMQGRLTVRRAEGTEPLWLSVSEEERQALRRMLRTVMQMLGAEVSTPERNRRLGALSQIRLLIERQGRQGAAWEVTRGGADGRAYTEPW